MKKNTTNVTGGFVYGVWVGIDRFRDRTYVVLLDLAVTCRISSPRYDRYIQ